MTLDDLGLTDTLTPADLAGLAVVFLVCLGVGILAGSAAGLAALRRREARRARGDYP